MVVIVVVEAVLQELAAPFQAARAPIKEIGPRVSLLG